MPSGTSSSSTAGAQRRSPLSHPHQCMSPLLPARGPTQGHLHRGWQQQRQQQLWEPWQQATPLAQEVQLQQEEEQPKGRG
jgi:hypothetical protein